jgi:transcriptional regulator with XRE-family HTH domain
MNKELFVQNVKKLCSQKGIRPTTACKESGVGGSFINDIERGRVPSVEKFQLLSAYLGVTTSDLLGERKNALFVSSLDTSPQESLEDLIEAAESSAQNLGRSIACHAEASAGMFSVSPETPVYIHFQAEAMQISPADETTHDPSTLTGSPIPVAQQKLLDAMISALADLNEEGRKKLMDYANDLVASGRYKK